MKNENRNNLEMGRFGNYNCFVHEDVRSNII